jgi:hypothetical protein
MPTVFLARGFITLWRWRRQFPPKYQFKQYAQGTMYQKTTFFLVIAVNRQILHPSERFYDSFWFLSAQRAVIQPLFELLLLCLICETNSGSLLLADPKRNTLFSRFVLWVTVDMCLLQPVTTGTTVSATSSPLPRIRLWACYRREVFMPGYFEHVALLSFHSRL